jgi:Protein of unknown function (DUF2785)
MSLIDIGAMTEFEIKKILTEINCGEKSWSEVNRLSIVKSMIQYIGSTDSELRELIYSSFYQLIIESNQLESELLEELLDICLDDLLFKGIGENGTDTVFIRVFTSLLLALILYRDNQDNFLSQGTIFKVKEKLKQYINAEEDLRGYVSDKGWAHSMAHVADAVDELVKSPKLNQQYYLEILPSLWNKIFVSSSVYLHDEDERVLTPIIQMLNNGLDVQEIEKLLHNLPIEMTAQKDQLEYEKYLFLRFNSKSFLKSFYIKVNRNDKLVSLQNSIEECLAKI